MAGAIDASLRKFHVSLNVSELERSIAFYRVLLGVEPAKVRTDWAGWINVVIAAVLMVATLPGRTQGLGLITEPLLTDLRIDRVTYAQINLWATLIGAAICLPVGRVFDRLGLRVATLAITWLLAAVVWTMSAMTGGLMLLFALVLATRALGQSALSVASITAVGKSFDNRVGVAMGVYAFLLSVLFAAAFVVVGNSVRVNGWRAAWAQIAIALIVAAFVALLLRERTGLVLSGALDPGAVRSPPEPRGLQGLIASA